MIYFQLGTQKSAIHELEKQLKEDRLINFNELGHKLDIQWILVKNIQQQHSLIIN